MEKGEVTKESKYNNNHLPDFSKIDEKNNSKRNRVVLASSLGHYVKSGK